MGCRYSLNFRRFNFPHQIQLLNNAFICVSKIEQMNFKSALGILRIFAIVEGISYLALGLTMPLKYWYDMPTPNKIIGMLHGVFFIGYCIMVYVVNQEQKWSLKTQFWAYIASLIPTGTFIADAKIFKPAQQKING